MHPLFGTLGFEMAKSVYSKRARIPKSNTIAPITAPRWPKLAILAQCQFTTRTAISSKREIGAQLA